MNMSAAVAEHLNQTCHCVGTDLSSLQAWIDRHLRAQGIAEPIVSSHPHLFSQTPIFLSRDHAERISQIVSSIEAVTALPKYREYVLSNAPSISRTPVGTRGVFLGYDFHISKEGPKLIEINTNAGGAMLNVALMRAQHACCPEVLDYLHAQPDADTLERMFVDMFRREWMLSRGSRPLETIAIVDDQPKSQFLYPEFLLFQKLFEEHGIRCSIASPEELVYMNGRLTHRELPIDLVYNRLTDFYLEGGSLSPLAAAIRDDAVVLTPHPQTHALYANKKNLALLSSSETLRDFGAPDEVIASVTAGVPRTLRFDSAPAEQWWESRKQWFFKPTTSFGSRGTYRGDKLTRKVFAEISQSDYVAQEVVPAPERELHRDSGGTLKFDVRTYAYDGQVQFLAARLYQGQTTNFRTMGGGFAPIYIV